MELKELKESLISGEHEKAIMDVYGAEAADAAAAAILQCADGYLDTFTDYGLAHAGHLTSMDIGVFSAPGRVEICGNHTDHQNGCVIASSIDLDMKAVAGANHENVIRIYSPDNGMAEASLDVLSPDPDEAGTSTAIVKGVASALKAEGYRVEGFNAYVISDVPKGSGLSSSAAFEILIGNIISGLFNDGAIDAVTMAKAGKIAENDFFGKPSGLMDQFACSVGGMIYIDLKDPDEPFVQKIDADLSREGYHICVTDTGSSHEDLTDAYASIPADMKAAAHFFGKDVLREVSEDMIKDSFASFMETLGERAAKRTVHFFNEQERVKDLKECLTAISEGRAREIFEKENADPEAEKLTFMQQALEIICESGDSSFRFLQNVCLPGRANESPLAEALDMSWELLQGRGGFRVHGGGFAGTILAIVPDDLVRDYKTAIEERFGSGSCRLLNVRKRGGCRII